MQAKPPQVVSHGAGDVSHPRGRVDGEDTPKLELERGAAVRPARSAWAALEHNSRDTGMAGPSP